jgi:aspartate/methionine/tyrosine aminotransferase
MSPCCRAATSPATSDGVNPGAGFIRIALVAPPAECDVAADRLAAFLSNRN